MGCSPILFLVVFIFVAINKLNALECFTGHSVIRGQSTKEKTEVCGKETDQCFKAKANVNAAIKIKLAGCSTIYGFDSCKV